MRGCTQGDTDSPIIFNTIIDAVIRTWKSNNKYCGSSALFYADDGLIENTEHNDLQTDMDIMIKLFERVGLKTNETKTKFMVFRGPAPPKAMNNNAYRRMKTGRGKTYEEQRKQKVACNICGKVITQGALQRHMKTQHNIKPEQYLYKETGPVGKFRVNIRKGKNNNCPIPGCVGSSKDKFGMYRHFCRRHVESTLTIIEDGPTDKCKLCGMHAVDLERHKKTKECQLMRERRKNERLQNKQAKAGEVKFHVYGKELEIV